MARTIWNYDSVKEFVESNGYILCSTREEIEINGRVKAKTKIKVWCKNKEHEPYDVTFDNFKGTSNKKGTRCEQCRRNKDIIWTREKIIDYVESNGYKFINFIEFDKYASRIEIECEKGHRQTRYFSNFHSGKRCRECWITWNEEEIIKFIEDEKYKFIKFVKFDNYASEIEIECEKGHRTTMIFRKFREGHRCSTCNESKGEKIIGEILTKENIEFERQYKFDNCKCKNLLPFDFYLPQYKICIEYDGIQHFEILPHWGGIDKLIETRIHDTIKTYYCQQNNIKLIRIPYWDYNNIEKILTNIIYE